MRWLRHPLVVCFRRSTGTALTCPRADYENWLVANPEHADAESVRDRADTHRNRWPLGYNHGLGLGYLTLGRPGTSSATPGTTAVRLPTLT